MNHFLKNDTNHGDSYDLVQAAQQGDRSALETLILQHQSWIYNISLRMVGDSFTAEDVTQEILIKMITKLSTFEGKSGFKTWLYRIVTNHVINMKKRGMETVFNSFNRHDSILQSLPSVEFSDFEKYGADAGLMIKETAMKCMMGMLMCLDRTQRLVFILGAILDVGSDVGGEIIQVRSDNFRQILSRARRQLGNYMNEKCGLMNERNSCRCANKTKAAIEAGHVDPNSLRFNSGYVKNIKDFVSEKANSADDLLCIRTQRLFRDHPFYESPDYVPIIKNMLNQMESHGWA